MDNQHKKIKGYRDISKEEIEMMNEGKELAERVGNFINKLAEPDCTTDKRWVAEARTDLQKGFMSAIRAIAQPTTF